MSFLFQNKSNYGLLFISIAEFNEGLHIDNFVAAFIESMARNNLSLHSPVVELIFRSARHSRLAGLKGYIIQ